MRISAEAEQNTMPRLLNEQLGVHAVRVALECGACPEAWPMLAMRLCPIVVNSVKILKPCVILYVMSHADIAEVMAGARSYDELDSKGQAVVRAKWARAMANRIKNLDLAAEFVAAGRPYVELDDEGQVVVVCDGGAEPTV